MSPSSITWRRCYLHFNPRCFTANHFWKGRSGRKPCCCRWPLLHLFVLFNLFLAVSECFADAGRKLGKVRDSLQHSSLISHKHKHDPWIPLTPFWQGLRVCYWAVGGEQLFWQDALPSLWSSMQNFRTPRSQRRRWLHGAQWLSLVALQGQSL